MTLLIILGALAFIAFFGGIPAISRLSDDRAQRLLREHFHDSKPWEN